MSLPANSGPRLAARAIIIEAGRILLVNAYRDGESDLWCAPGGGVERHQSIPDNLKREVYEETGLTIAVGGLVAVNEFHDPATDFHQVELFFAATILSGTLNDVWTDPDGIVTQRRFLSGQELRSVRYKPDSLADLMAETALGKAFVRYDPLEHLVR